MRQHCPECGCDAVALTYVTPVKLRKQCTSCKHRWSEERPQPLVSRPGYIANAAIEEKAS
jgi:hypothetical protein